MGVQAERGAGNQARRRSSLRTFCRIATSRFSSSLGKLMMSRYRASIHSFQLFLLIQKLAALTGPVKQAVGILAPATMLAARTRLREHAARSLLVDLYKAASASPDPPPSPTI